MRRTKWTLYLSDVKILKYAGIVLIILLTAFFSIGIFFSPFDYQAEVVINASPQKCWHALHDTSRMKKWMPGLKSLTLKKGSPNTVGAEYEIILDQDKRYVMTEKITGFKENEFEEFELTNDVLNAIYRYHLTSSALQTKIELTYHVTGRNLLWKSILWLSQSFMREAALTELTLLKIEIESGEMEFD